MLNHHLNQNWNIVSWTKFNGIWIGLKRYAQPTIWYIRRYICHSYLGSRGLWSWPAIRNTALHLLQLPAQEWCAVVTTMAASSEFPDAVCLWWIYSFYWNKLIVSCGILCSFLTLVCVTNVPYPIVSSSERIAICNIAFVLEIYRCAGVLFQP